MCPYLLLHLGRTRGGCQRLAKGVKKSRVLSPARDFMLINFLCSPGRWCPDKSNKSTRLCLGYLVLFWVLQRGIFFGSDGKASARNVGDQGSIPGLGRCPREGNGNPLQYSYLENSMNGEASWATVHGVAKSRTRLSDFTFNM